jgi:chemotaxis protein CheX
MDVAIINPFIEATTHVFTTMLGCTPKRGQPKLAQGEEQDVVRTAIIGLSGTMRGAVAVAFPSKTAHNVVKKVLQTQAAITDDEINDAIGEVANMIAGNSKARLTGHTISISLPTVVKGQKYYLVHPKKSVTIAVPFESDHGQFTLYITMETAGGQGKQG